MPAGRPPKPSQLKQLEGNPGGRTLPDEPTPEVEIPDCPDHLAPAAVAEWNRISRELHALGLIAKMDRAVLAAYCQAYARWVEAECKIKEDGSIVKSPNGYPMMSPWLVIANKALEQMHKFAIEFGLTPAARSRVSRLIGGQLPLFPAPGDASSQEDAFGQFLQGATLQ